MPPLWAAAAFRLEFIRGTPLIFPQVMDPGRAGLREVLEVSTITWRGRMWTAPHFGAPSWWRSLAARLATAPERPAARRGVSRFLITRESDGRWSVKGGSEETAPHFELLSQAVVYARGSCGGAPAMIELRIGDVVAVIHQSAGWPKAICGARGG